VLRRFFSRGLSTIIISRVLSLGTKRPPFSCLFIVFFSTLLTSLDNSVLGHIDRDVVSCFVFLYIPQLFPFS
jgi:hypothetical protein